MKKYIVLISLCCFALVQMSATAQPSDSVRVYKFGNLNNFEDFEGFEFEMKDLRESMKDMKVDMQALKENMKNMKEWNYNLDRDSIARHFRNYKIDTFAFREYRDMAMKDGKRWSEFSKRRNVYVYQNRKPSRTENKVFTNISKVNFSHKHGNIVVRESASNQVSLQIKYYDSHGKQAKVDMSTANRELTINTSNTNLGGPTIDFVLSIPRNMALNMDIVHGNVNIQMDKYLGVFTLNSTYGNLRAQSISGKPVFSGKYGNVKLDNAEDIVVNADYTNFKIDKADNVITVGKHNNFVFDNVKNIKTEGASTSGNFKLGNVESIDGNMKYSNITINNLGSFINTNCDYSNIKINNVSPNLKKININGSYSDITVNIPTTVSASFDVNLKNGNLNVDGRHTVKYTEKSETSRSVVKKGQIGNKKPTAVILISNRYADVKFK